MLRRTSWILLLVSIATSISAQQTIYWKKDHIYNGPGGKEIAVMMPAPTDQTAPTTPTGLSSSSVSATSVSLSWSGSTDSGGSGLAGYKVYRQQGTGASLPVGTVGSGVLSFVDQPLTPSTAYTYTIVAFDNAENHSAPSTGVSVTALSSAGDTTPPTVPSNLRGQALNDVSSRLDWYPSADTGGSGVAGYKVYRGGALISGSNPITAIWFQDTGLNPGTTYSYTVAAVDNAGNVSTQSSAVSVTTPWVTVFTDTFNRANSSSTLNNSNWAGNGVGWWGILSNMANLPASFGQQGWLWGDAFAAATQTSFRATLSLPAAPANPAGISFWASSRYPAYRAYIYWLSGYGYVYLNYYDSQGNQYSLGSALIYALGSIRVQAYSSSRTITVSVNGVQQISYTETDYTRANSGYVGLTGYMNTYVTSDTNVGTFTLEK